MNVESSRGQIWAEGIAGYYRHTGEAEPLGCGWFCSGGVSSLEKLRAEDRSSGRTSIG